MSIEHTTCFFGHRKINATADLKNRLYSEIENLIIVEGIKTFLFGSKSQFDDLCYDIVSDLKTKYPDIKRIYIRAEFEYIDGEVSRAYREGLLARYEETYYPESVSGAGKAVYVKRNQYMIEKSLICVVYYDENYLPVRRKQSREDLFDYHTKSGTGIAYKYAEKKKKKIINVFNK